MESLTCTATLEGADSILVAVECSTTSGFAGLHLVGNTGDGCRDGKERAKTALEKLGLNLGHKRILINLAPAHARKEGNHFDLPIAVSLAALSREEPMAHNPAEWLFAAELGLDGSLRPVRALIPMLLQARQNGIKGMVIAASHRLELSALNHLPLLRDAVQILYFDHLREVLEWLFLGQTPQAALGATQPSPPETNPLATFDDMLLSPDLEMLALTCAVGRHSLLLRGTPGSGKSMFVKRLPSILPHLNPQRHLEALQIHSLQHDRLPRPLMEGFPPFRHPHHAASAQAIIGTGQQPGDLALAHGGMIFLDEFPEFRRDLLEALREPLEQGAVYISRAQHKTMWPADVQFVAACNNCPCGWYGSRRRLCRCTTQKRLAYWNRLSGPILDRIDVHYNMPEVPASTWHQFASDGEQRRQVTSQLRSRVLKIREWSEARLEAAGIRANADLTSEMIPPALGCREDVFRQYLETLENLKLSGRAVLRCLRVARTLADLESSDQVKTSHINRAAQWQHALAAKARGEVVDTI